MVPQIFLLYSCLRINVQKMENCFIFFVSAGFFLSCCDVCFFCPHILTLVLSLFIPLQSCFLLSIIHAFFLSFLGSFVVWPYLLYVSSLPVFTLFLYFSLYVCLSFCRSLCSSFFVSFFISCCFLILLHVLFVMHIFISVFRCLVLAFVRSFLLFLHFSSAISVLLFWVVFVRFFCRSFFSSLLLSLSVVVI